jgi:hypothetical protein
MMVPCRSKHVTIVSMKLYYKYIMKKSVHFAGLML